MAHEAFALSALALKGQGANELYDPDRVVVVLDHCFPALPPRWPTHMS